MSETGVPQEAIIVATLNKDLEHQPNQVVLIDPEKDSKLKAEVNKAIQRMNNPEPRDQMFEGRSETSQEILTLLRYVTEDHPVFSKYERPYMFDDEGDFVPNPNHVGGVPEDYSAFQDDKPEYLGDLVAEKGDLCYGQSLFVSTVLDQRGFENGVVQFISNNPEEPDHAVVVVKTDNDDIVLDPMYGTMVYRVQQSEVYDALYGDMIPLGFVKDTNQSVTISSNG